MKTVVTQMINEFNKELEVAKAIGNEDKIRTIKHLINLASFYLPNERQQIVDAFSTGYNYCYERELECQNDDFEIDYYNETYNHD